MSILQDLNPPQQAAVEHIEGPLLVLAGAGSGKTRVVTHRIIKLLEIGVAPSDILALTFTNKAADEMKRRVRLAKRADILASTFHSLGARILRESISALGYSSEFTIYDQDDTEKLLKHALGSQPNKTLFKQMRSQISHAKNHLLDPEQITQDVVLKNTYQIYQNKLKECNAVDFDDLLYLTVKLLHSDPSIREDYQNRWLFLLIDEYQDTNLAQYTLAKLLVGKHSNIFAVGDPDQSIYSWRGAQYQNILNFESDFPGAKVITLDQNYRSTNKILQAANGLIQHNETRYQKKLWSALGDGTPIVLYKAHNETEEAFFVASCILGRLTQDRVPLDEIAILYRTNAQSRPFEDILLARKIPYTIIGGISFYDRKEIKDLLGFIRMLFSSSDAISFLRTLNIPRRGIGVATVEKITTLASRLCLPILTFCEELILSPSLQQEIKLGSKQKEGIEQYLSLLRKLKARLNTTSIHEFIHQLIVDTDYLSYLKEDLDTYQDRKENVEELVSKAFEWEQAQSQPTLFQFVEELSLRATMTQETKTSTLKLMTLHNSKGLEFKAAFLVGLEEDMLPHINAKQSTAAIEEERRLCYVGMTRAKEYLYLSYTTSRHMWGGFQPMRPSRFLKEIPQEYIQSLSTQKDVSLSSMDSEETFSVGDEIIHSHFGKGTIQAMNHGSIGLTYEIYFFSAQETRTLAAKYAKLKRSS